ncbi:MAG: glycosyltransferase family 2 protein [Actinomycetes bacterium]
MADTNFVTAVLVTHDGAIWLPEVIASIGSQSRAIDRIVAVDTASVDTSQKLLKSAGITTFLEDREMGYGDAIEHALALTPAIASPEGNQSNEWIWLIHDDCAPDRDALKLLLEAVEERPQVAIAGPKLRDWYDRDRLLEVGLSIAGNGSRWTGLEDNEQDQGQHDSIKEVMSVSTAGALIRRSVFEELGGLDINLALFRDDVDLGWRAHVAGYQVICVEKAVAFHAEASASERRRVDVSEAFLQRPLLLDRRNAAYVLLVNSTWWLLPWIALQLLVTSVARAIINLLAKLPGYAGDEIAAVALLLAHPAELFQARRARKKKRLLSARVVSHFIPSTWSQLQIAFERAGSAIASWIAPVVARREELRDVEVSQTIASESSDDSDEIDSLPVETGSLWKALIRKPQFLIAFVIAAISLIASRGRFGSLSGGALALSQGSGLDLLHRYSESWHLVGLGSAAPMPPWIAFLGISSILTLGNLPLLITLIFLFAPAISFLAIYRVLLRQGVQRNYGLVGAAIYSASPLLWACINQGRLGTLFVLQLAPTLLSLNPFSRERDQSTWRRIFAISLLAGVIGSFSPLLLIIWSAIHLVILIQSLIERRHQMRELGWVNVLFSDLLDGAKRRLALCITPLLLTFPWSASLLIHPTQILLEPGIPLSSGSRFALLLFNPGGVSAPPIWVVAPFVLMLAITLLVDRLRIIGLLVSGVVATALVISQIIIVGHGSSARVWSGPLLAIAMILLLAPTLIFAQEYLPTLPERRVGLRHFGWAGMALVVAFNLIAMPIWAATGGANSLVTSKATSNLPAFVTALEQTPARPKTVVLRATGKETTYFFTRGAGIYLGDADVSIVVPSSINQAMNELVSGAGLTSAKTLGLYGVQYLYLQNPAPISVVRTIDGVGGFSRMSATTRGTLWRVVKSSPRVLFIGATGSQVALDSHDVSANSMVPSAGVVQLAEKYDQSWRLLLDGRPIPLERSANDLPIFTIPQSGEVALSHDGTLRRALISIELITLIFALVMALPAGRRRRDIATAEVAS